MRFNKLTIMPFIQNTDYNPPFIFRNNHLNTIMPALFRKVKDINYTRFRIETNDHDFIDIDRSSVDSKTAAIITHGLEGNSHKPYIKGITKILNEIGVDAIATNLRGCSGEPNHLLSSYHSGKTDDLAAVINHARQILKYEKIVLIGFSLGGNITLKYVGELGRDIPDFVKLAIAISVPCDLKSSAIHLSKASNWIYLQRFLRSLKQKALDKMKVNNALNMNRMDIIKTKSFFEFDNLFTAPIHGFEDAEDYWAKCSCKQFLTSISIPTLLINAKDDPFLPDECYPYTEANSNHFLYFEVPEYGGHVGFMTNYHFKFPLWHEKRIMRFLNEKLT